MNDINFNLGDNLRTIRKVKGLSVTQVVNKLKDNSVYISSSTFYAWEEGRPIPHKYILPLCMSLNITIDFLYVINNNSPLLNEKINYIKSIESFLRDLDDQTCKMLIQLERNWEGDLKASLIMLGIYSSLPLKIRRDIANLCLYDFNTAIKENNIDISIAENIDMKYYQAALYKLYKNDI